MKLNGSHFINAILVIISITLIQALSDQSDKLAGYTKLQKEYSDLQNDYSKSCQQVDKYELTHEYLRNLGASSKQATTIIKASKAYDLSPKTLGALVYSESSFKNRTHSLPYVVGLCGINTQANPLLPYNPYTDAGNIFCAASLLRTYKNTYETDLRAIKRYKGWSSEGETQARSVLHIKNHPEKAKK